MVSAKDGKTVGCLTSVQPTLLALYLPPLQHERDPVPTATHPGRARLWQSWEQRLAFPLKK